MCVGDIRSYRDLEIWKIGVDLTVACYEITSGFPKEELFTLTSQIRRAAGSVPANIAEGHGRESTGEFVRFLQIAQGSLKELETHLIVCERIGLADASEIEGLMALSERLGRMMRGMIRSLQERRG
ncbi:MAG: four helix bundle protein [Phycisphaerales bacterium]|nr:four helix bundle protein [Phycisphaerales bacterium]